MTTAIAARPPAPPVRAVLRTIALAGNPNSGKTTLFNALTGLHQKVANYPGVTVEKKSGRCHLPQESQPSEILDLPGTYSLIPGSPDEQITADVLCGRIEGTPAPDAVVVVVDASNLPRSLYLVTQLIDLGLPLVVALNMSDIASRRGLSVDATRLSELLGVAVIPMVSHHRRGLQDLRQALLTARIPTTMRWEVPEALLAECRALSGVLGSSATGLGGSAHRLLIGDRSGELGNLAATVRAQLQESAARLAALGVDAVEADITARYRWIDGVVAQVVSRSAAAAKRPLTEGVDGVLMHPVSGLIIFALVMAVVFISVFWIAQPLMDGLQHAITALGTWTLTHLDAGPLKSLISDGIIKGVGTVVAFVPQIAILFLFLAVLEDSGYLARAAFLMDRILAKVGLHGKSFIPLLSSFACAIPGIMSARTIENRKDRLATILVAPFMSCSARLPVYILLINACFTPVIPERYQSVAKGLIMLACYVLGVVAAGCVAWIFRKSLLRAGPQSSFILEMPSYKLPQWSEVLRQMWVNASKFLTKAGTVIFAFSVLMWAAMYWPRLPESQAKAIASQVSATVASDDEPLADRIDDAQSSAQTSQSYAGRFGHLIAPALAPIGADWKTGIGLVGAFAAREVFVSTLGIVYGAGDTEERGTGKLSDALMHDRRPNGMLVWTPLAATSILIWFVLAMQCMSTVAVVRRETGGWSWAIAMLVFMNVLAYVVCLGVYQVGSRIWGA
jgi:ferrous iron transport protein B